MVHCGNGIGHRSSTGRFQFDRLSAVMEIGLPCGLNRADRRISALVTLRAHTAGKFLTFVSNILQVLRIFILIALVADAGASGQ
jgi:hypothetical protein